MRCAVIGDPVAHSLSPAIHRAGYREAGLDWSYEAIPVAPEWLNEFIFSCEQAGDWAGLSVTAPHKEALLGFGTPDSVAQLVGGGNTITFGNQPRVYNTDVPGFVRAWRRRGLEQLNSAAIVGGGATARSLLVALSGLAVRKVTVLARTPAKANGLRELGIALGIDTVVQPLEANIEADLLANTIPGPAVEPHASRFAGSVEVIFDAVYDPWPSPLAAAAGPGQPVITGLELLAGQAVDQFQLLTGHPLSFEVAISAARLELQGRGCL